MTGQFEIPEAMREFAEKSMDQARKAFDDYMNLAQKATEGLAASGSGVPDSAKRMHEETIAFAEANVAASFELAQRLVRARDFEEMAKIQQEFLRQQMAAFEDQSRRLGKIAEQATKGKRN
jgi:phasin